MNDNESKLDLFNALGARSASWDMMFVLGEDGQTYSFGIPKKAIFVSCDVQEDIRHVNKNHKNLYFKNGN